MARPKKEDAIENTDNIGNNDNDSATELTTKNEEECPAEKVKEKEKAESDNVNALLLKKLAELEEKIGELEETKNRQPDRYSTESRFGVVRSKNIPKSDKLDKPKTFVMMGRGYVLSVYNHEGSEVLAPYGLPVQFKWKNSEKRQTLDGEQAIHYSTFSTYSKKEVEFIKNSPFFGTLIFDSVTDLEEVNPALVSSIEQASTYVANMTQEELFGLAHTYKLDINMPINKLKTKLIAIKVQEITSNDAGLYRSVISKSGLVHEFTNNR